MYIIEGYDEDTGKAEYIGKWVYTTKTSDGGYEHHVIFENGQMDIYHDSVKHCTNLKR